MLYKPSLLLDDRLSQSDILSSCLSGIPSDIFSDILLVRWSWTQSGIPPGLLSDIDILIWQILSHSYLTILCGIQESIISNILFAILSGIFFVHSFWDPILHLFWCFIWHYIWHSVWQLVWQSFWHVAARAIQQLPGLARATPATWARK